MYNNSDQIQRYQYSVDKRIGTCWISGIRFDDNASKQEIQNTLAEVKKRGQVPTLATLGAVIKTLRSTASTAEIKQELTNLPIRSSKILNGFKICRWSNLTYTIIAI